MVRRLACSRILWGVCMALYVISTLYVALNGRENKGLVVLPHEARKVTTLMKTDAISGHERATIIAELARRGKWEARRLGANIQLIRFTTREGEMVCYSVAVSSHVVVSARAKTVFDAVLDINRVIALHVPARQTGGREDSPLRTGLRRLLRRGDPPAAQETLL